MLRATIRANAVLPRLGRALLARAGDERARTRALSAATRLKSTGTEQPAGELSGGNQQKVVFARALCAEPRLLLLEEPTRGVDVGAKFEIHGLVRRLAADGCAVVLTSTDLPELLGMCDRILVLQGGRQAHLIPAEGLGPADLLALFYDDPEDAP
jgi:ABC-type sugar transport system ATPase subunit